MKRQQMKHRSQSASVRNRYVIGSEALRRFARGPLERPRLDVSVFSDTMTAGPGFRISQHQAIVGASAAPTEIVFPLDATQILMQPRDERLYDGIASLQEIYRECSERNWDGYDAERVQSGTVAVAERFLRSLPGWVAPPEVSADPDGEITMDWYAGPRLDLSVSIGSDGRLTYSGVFGRERARGTTYFVNEPPGEILGYLRKVLT